MPGLNFPDVEKDKSVPREKYLELKYRLEKYKKIV